jgi:CubicO group peptidase (beta-lactamase class C family)
MYFLVRCLPALLAAIALSACQLGPPAAPLASPPATAALVIDATLQQDQRFAAAFQEVDAWVEKQAFPGAVLAVGVGGRLVALQRFGRIDASPQAPAMPVDAIFDVASLTKVAATTTAIGLLMDQGRLQLDTPVVQYLPEFAGPAGHAEITVRHLLAHNAGLPSPARLWKVARTREELLMQIYRHPSEAPAGSRYVYRDENFILLGEIVERLAGEPMDRSLARRMFAPLGMADTGFNPSASLLPRIAPTELDDYYRHRLVRGTVHDEKADLMGGVAGHAGLFSTAADLARLAQLYLDGGRGLLSAATLQALVTRQDQPAGSTRALGWDTPGRAGTSFAGPLASPDAVMHTGFTGTSLYIDRARGAYIVLLTNRVNPTRENRQISPARIAIHTAVLKALDAPASNPSRP